MPEGAESEQREEAQMEEMEALYLPTPSIATYNCQSLGTHATDREGKRKANRKLNFITKLARRCDITCLQETWLGKFDSRALSMELGDTHIIYYNNDQLNRGGTMVLIKKIYAKSYSIGEEILLAGRVQEISLRHESPLWRSKSHFTVYYFYLPSGNKERDRLALIKQIADRRKGRTDHMFLTGDFNMTDTPADCTPPNSSSQLTGGSLDEWEQRLKEMGLQEVYQAAHTYFHISQRAEEVRSARLDRFYTSLSAGERAIAVPHAEVTHAGALSESIFEGLEADGEKGSRFQRAFKRLHTSDHLGVILTFKPGFGGRKKGGFGFDAPRWLGKDEEVAEEVHGMWNSYAKNKVVNPYTALADWKACIRRVVRSRFKRQNFGEKMKADSYRVFTAGLGLLRACMRKRQNHQHIEKLKNSASELAERVKLVDGYYEHEGLSEYVEKLLEVKHREAIRAASGDWKKAKPLDLLPETYIPGQSAKANPITAIKERLPSPDYWSRSQGVYRPCIQHE